MFCNNPPVSKALRTALSVLLMLFSIASFSASSDIQTITIHVVDSKVVGENTIRLVEGDQAQLQWITDKTLQIHLHGYDIEKSIQAQSKTIMQLKAYATGRFPVSVHSHAGAEQTLLYLEVHPR